MAKNPLKQLAGETAVYGLSTILARIINFLFVPFYTRLLTTANYGVVTEFMAYIAVLQVVLTMGLETGCFRFANKEGAQPNRVYSSALAMVSGVSLGFFALMVVFAEPLAHLLGYDGYGSCMVYMGGILALDSITAILFAKLRQEHRAVKFAVFKTLKILVETGANILLFFPFVSLCSRSRCVRSHAFRCVAAAFRQPDSGFQLCDFRDSSQLHRLRPALHSGPCPAELRV